MKRIVSIATSCLLLLAVAFSLASCATWDGMKEDIKGLFAENEEQNDALPEEETDDLEIDTTKSKHFAIRPSMAKAVAATETTPAHIEKTLTAIVVPAEAKAELVWSVYWLEDKTEGEDVADYVTIHPSEDTLSATVSCWKPFAGKIGIKVALRANTDIFDECTAIYVGVPTSLHCTISDDTGSALLPDGNKYSLVRSEGQGDGAYVRLDFYGNNPFENNCHVFGKEDSLEISYRVGGRVLLSSGDQWIDIAEYAIEEEIAALISCITLDKGQSGEYYLTCGIYNGKQFYRESEVIGGDISVYLTVYSPLYDLNVEFEVVFTAGETQVSLDNSNLEF